MFQMAKWFGIEDFFKMLTEEQLVFIDFLVYVKVTPHECVNRTGLL